MNKSKSSKNVKKSGGKESKEARPKGAENLESANNERLVTNETSNIGNVGSTCDNTFRVVPNVEESDEISRILQKVGINKVLKIIAASGASESVLKSQEEYIEKLRAAVPTELKVELPSKETLIDAGRYIPAESYSKDLTLIRDISQTIQKTDYDVKFTTVKIEKTHIPKTNLSIITSAFGRQAVIIEKLPLLELRKNVSIDVQAALLAINWIQVNDFGKPTVLDSSGNYVTHFHSEAKFTQDGYSMSDLIQRLTSVAKANDEQAYTPAQIREIRNSAVIIDTVGGKTETHCMDGLIQSQMVNTCVSVWEKHIIKLTQWMEEIRPYVPPNYKIKEYSVIEKEYGKVFYRPNTGNLELLARLLPEKLSTYYLKIFLNFLDNAPLSINSSSAISSSFGVEFNITPGKPAYGGQLISALNSGNFRRSAALYLLSCIASNMILEIEYSDTPGIVDAAAAMLSIAYMGRHVLSEAGYLDCLKVLFCFIDSRTYHSIRNETVETLRHKLYERGWRLLDRVASVQDTVTARPILSPRSTGSYYLPFNLDANGESLHLDIEDIGTNLRRTNFSGVGHRNSDIGNVLGLVLKRTISNVKVFSNGYVKLLGYLRVTIPDALARTLNCDGTEYKIRAVDWMSFFLSMGEVIPSSQFDDNLRVFTESLILDFSQMSQDLSQVKSLLRTILREPRRANVSAFNYTSAISRLVEEIWKDTAPMVSPTFNALLSIAALDGKHGYNELMKKLAEGNFDDDDEPISEMIVKLTDIIKNNFLAFGVANEVYIVPSDSPNITRHAELSTIFSNCPFLATMPSNVPRVHYDSFINDANSTELVLGGVIVYGAPLRVSYRIGPSIKATRATTDSLAVNDYGISEIGPINWDISFEESTTNVADFMRIHSRRWEMLILAPPNIKPLSRWQEYMTTYTNADTNDIYIDDHVYLYSRP